MTINCLFSRLTLMLFIGIIGCVTEFDPLETCTSDRDCFRGEVCLKSTEGDARCVPAGSEPVMPSRTDGDSGLVDALVSADANADDAALPSDVGTPSGDMSTTQLPTPLVRWKFDAKEPSSLLSTGEIEGLTFMLNGGALLDANGLNLTTTSTDAVSANAFLTGETSDLFARITESNTFSIRLWIWTKHPLQDGPARIFTWSQDSALRNLTIGQVSSGKVNVRVRFDNGFTNENGLVPVPSEDCPTCVEQVIGSEADSLNPESGFQQVVMQYDALGTVELWVDGVVADRSCVVDDVPGGFSTWDPSFGIALGDELFNSQPRIDTAESANHNRPWDGVIHSLEIYADPIEESQIREWLSDKPTFQASDAETIGFVCPTADSTPWMVTSCDVSGVTDVDGRYCQYSVGAGTDDGAITCEAFCDNIGMRTCSAGATCCWNHVDDDLCLAGTPIACQGESGTETQICRCFERN